jgi:hypothetical protein
MKGELKKEVHGFSAKADQPLHCVGNSGQTDRAFRAVQAQRKAGRRAGRGLGDLMGVEIGMDRRAEGQEKNQEPGKEIVQPKILRHVHDNNP